MSLKEIAWRAQSAARVPFDRIAMLQTKPGGGRTPSVPDWWKLRNYPFSVAGPSEQIEEIPVFDLKFAVDFDFDWHTDYRHQKVVDREFAPSLDIRDTSVVGDIKYIWEINRHHHLSALAHSSRADAAAIVERSLRSWIEANPYLRGVNWTSSLELGLRMMSWSLLMPVLRPALERDAQFREALAGQIFLHLQRIRQKLSLHSSANNHLIGELCGLYVGSACFPWWPETAEWRSMALAMLDKEVGLQFAPDGVNREQAFSYQLFTLEMLFLAWATAIRVGDPVPPNFTLRLKSALHFVHSIATSKGDVPWYGDSDDARGFILSYKDSQLEAGFDLGARLLGMSPFAAQANGGTRAGAILGPVVETATSKARASGSPWEVRTFDEGGYLVVSGGDSKLVADFGPLGYTNIAAHGHADALSLWLAVDGEYLLVDAGTYAYHSHQNWRSYFRSTAAHNTVEVDGLDQSTMAGRFLWSQKAAAALIESRETAAGVFFRMQHDGYMRLADPVRHERQVEFAPEMTRLQVKDVLDCKGRHAIAVHWHLHPDAEVAIKGNVAEITFRSKTYRLTCDGTGFELDAVRGSESPILGWHSPAFNHKNPTWTIRFRGNIEGRSSVQTTMEPVDGR